MPLQVVSPQPAVAQLRLAPAGLLAARASVQTAGLQAVPKAKAFAVRPQAPRPRLEREGDDAEEATYI